MDQSREPQEEETWKCRDVGRIHTIVQYVIIVNEPVSKSCVIELYRVGYQCRLCFEIERPAFDLLSGDFA